MTPKDINTLRTVTKLAVEEAQTRYMNTLKGDDIESERVAKKWMIRIQETNAALYGEGLKK